MSSERDYKTCAELRLKLNLSEPLCCALCHGRGALVPITVEGENYVLCCKLAHALENFAVEHHLQIPVPKWWN